jgi:hypothetical protein
VSVLSDVYVFSLRYNIDCFSTEKNVSKLGSIMTETWTLQSFQHILLCVYRCTSSVPSVGRILESFWFVFSAVTFLFLVYFTSYIFDNNQKSHGPKWDVWVGLRITLTSFQMDNFVTTPSLWGSTFIICLTESLSTSGTRLTNISHYDHVLRCFVSSR